MNSDLPLVYAYKHRCECGSAFCVDFSNTKIQHTCDIKYVKRLHSNQYVKKNCIIKCKKGYYTWDETKNKYIKFDK